MSAYVVEDKTINRIVTWLTREVVRDPWFKRKLENGLNISTEDKDWEKSLALAMFQLNVDGVNARYGQNVTHIKPLTFTYTPVYTATRVQVLKSLECWLYQCCEEGTKESVMYRFFDEWVSRYLMSQIIDSLPEYQKAEGG